MKELCLMKKNLLAITSLLAYEDTKLYYATLKYKDHPGIRVFKRVSQRFSGFYMSPVDKIQF